MDRPEPVDIVLTEGRIWNMNEPRDMHALADVSSAQFLVLKYLRTQAWMCVGRVSSNQSDEHWAQLILYLTGGGDHERTS